MKKRTVLKDYRRMCNSNACSTCPLNFPKITCGKYIDLNPEEAEKLVIEWAEKNPFITNADKFEEVFGVEPNTNCCVVKTMGECVRHNNCDECKYDSFWMKEYKQPKGSGCVES